LLAKAMATSVTSVAILLVYLAGLIAFVLFYGKEEGTKRAYLGAFAAILIAFLLGVFYRITIIGAMVAATFYVADKKNRSRLWAIPAMFFGPFVLLVVVLLPKHETPTLSLTGPS
jgi:hypothetical protein